MRSLAAIPFLVGVGLSATPIPFSGQAEVALDIHDVSLTGLGNGFLFFNLASYGSYRSNSHLWGDRFDVSYDFQVLLDTACGSGSRFLASNGSTSASAGLGDCSEPPGVAAGHITWTGAPVEIVKPHPWGYDPTTIDVPITIFGDLRAWTHAGWLSHQAPFFDYQIRGSGVLSASFDISPEKWNISVATFTGVAEPTPEPASWLLALPFGAFLLYRAVRWKLPTKPR